MRNVEKKELAKKLGVDNILVSYFSEPGFKTNLTVIIDEDFLMNYIGQTYTFVPLTAEGLNKKLGTMVVKNLLDTINDELTKEIKPVYKEITKKETEQDLEIEKE